MATTSNKSDRKVTDAEDKNKNGVPDEYESEKGATVSEYAGISQDQAATNSASDLSVKPDPVVRVGDKSEGQVFVKLLAKSYVRHDWELKKTKKFRQGEKFWVTDTEFEKLSSGNRPRVEETEED